MVKLLNQHIIITKQIVDLLFEDSVQVNWIYYPLKKTLLVAAFNDLLFKSLHKTSTSVLKHKNNNGERSLSIMELLIDNDLNIADKELKYNADEKMKILSVYFDN